MDTISQPRSIDRIGDEYLAIRWEDGHESFYELASLRKNCPCAGCRAQAEGTPPQVSPRGALALLPDPIRLLGIEEVGRYALRLRWSDGHATGLYDFRLLRALCRCESCVPEKA